MGTDVQHRCRRAGREEPLFCPDALDDQHGGICPRHGVNITLHGGDAGTEREQLTRLADYRVDGIILSSVNEGEAYRTFLESLHRPIVSVDNRIADGIPFVGIDQRAAVREAVQRAAEKGYERIVFVCPPLDTKNRRNLYVHKGASAGA